MRPALLVGCVGAVILALILPFWIALAAAAVLGGLTAVIDAVIAGLWERWR